MAKKIILHNEDVYVKAWIDPDGDRFSGTTAHIGHFGSDNYIYLCDVKEMQVVINYLQRVIENHKKAKKGKK